MSFIVSSLALFCDLGFKACFNLILLMGMMSWCEQVQKCTMTVWSQPWLSSMKLTDFHCKAMTDNDVNDVQKMPEFGVGGHKPVDVSGLQVKQAVDFVIKYLNSESDDLYTLELFQVVNGTQQVHLLCVTV